MIVAKDVLKNHQLLDVVTIIMPLQDMRDAMKKKITASLLHDGSGMVITVPSVPSYLIHKVDALHGLEAAKNKCEKTGNAHKALANAIKTNPERSIKKIILKFPLGVKCKTEFFNHKDLYKLKLNIRLLKDNVDMGSGTNIEVTNCFIFWKLVVDQETRSVQEDTGNESDDDLNESIQRMSLAAGVATGSNTPEFNTSSMNFF